MPLLAEFMDPGHPPHGTASHWPLATCKVFGDQLTCEKFMLIRVVYLFSTLPDLIETKGLVLDVDSAGTETLSEIMGHLGDMRSDRHLLSVFSCFDTQLSDPDWVPVWSSLLLSAKDRTDLITKACDLAKLPREEVLGTLAPKESFEAVGEKSEAGQFRPGFGRANGTADAEDSEDQPALVQSTRPTQEAAGSSKEGNCEQVTQVDLPPHWINLELVKLTEANSFMVSEFFNTTYDAKKVNLGSGGIVPRTFDVVQSKLECALISLYLGIADETGVMVNLSSDKKADRVTVKVPVSSNVRLPLIGSVSQRRGKNSSPLVKIFGVDFFMNPRTDPTVNAAMIPGWCSKTVTRNDIAYFAEDTMKCQIAVIKTGEGPCDLDIFYVPENSNVKDEYANDEYCVYDLDVKYLKPLPDIADKLSADVAEQRKRLEKTTRAMVKQCGREAENEAKAAQKKKAEVTSKAGKPKKGHFRGLKQF